MFTATIAPATYARSMRASLALIDAAVARLATTGGAPDTDETNQAIELLDNATNSINLIGTDHLALSHAAFAAKRLDKAAARLIGATLDNATPIGAPGDTDRLTRITAHALTATRALAAHAA